MGFKKATKAEAKARLALCGLSGSGKTYSALAIARGLGQRVALLDTEHGSSRKYSDIFDFDVDVLAVHHPQRYIEAIQLAEREGYDVLIIDSLSHAWMGKSGALELVDRLGNRGNSFAAWGKVSPLHQDLIEAIVGARLHVIATMRTKTEYVIENVGGKQVPKKIGTAPVQRDGMEYEFDVVIDLDRDHNGHIGKTRCAALDGAIITRPGAELGRTIAAWLSVEAPPEPPESFRPATLQQVEHEIEPAQAPKLWPEGFANHGLLTLEEHIADAAARIGDTDPKLALAAYVQRLVDDGSFRRRPDAQAAIERQVKATMKELGAERCTAEVLAAAIGRIEHHVQTKRMSRPVPDEVPAG